MANFVSPNQIQIQIGLVLLVWPDTRDDMSQPCSQLIPVMMFWDNLESPFEMYNAQCVCFNNLQKPTWVTVFVHPFDVVKLCYNKVAGYGAPTEKIKVQRPRPSILPVSQGGRRAASLFRNLRQLASQNLSEQNVAVLTAPSFLERFCEADWRNSETM